MYWVSYLYRIVLFLFYEPASRTGLGTVTLLQEPIPNLPVCLLAMKLKIKICGFIIHVVAGNLAK